jgi:putative protease
MMPIMEDELGTYIMNSKDLRAVEHVKRLVNIGVDSLKIEGRTKSHYYAARTAQVYRQAIDDAVAGRDFDPELLSALAALSNRGYTDGFYQRHHTIEQQNYLTNYSKSKQQQFVGEITGYDQEKDLVSVLAKNKFTVGDSLELILPDGNQTFQLTYMENPDGTERSEAPGGGYEVLIRVPNVKPDFGLITKNLSARNEVFPSVDFAQP